MPQFCNFQCREQLSFFPSQIVIGKLNSHYLAPHSLCICIVTIFLHCNGIFLRDPYFNLAELWSVVEHHFGNTDLGYAEITMQSCTTRV
jgi:hypothetical protein